MSPRMRAQADIMNIQPVVVITLLVPSDRSRVCQKKIAIPAHAEWRLKCRLPHVRDGGPTI